MFSKRIKVVGGREVGFRGGGDELYKVGRLEGGCVGGVVVEMREKVVGGGDGREVGGKGGRKRANQCFRQKQEKVKFGKKQRAAINCEEGRGMGNTLVGK